MNAVVVKKEKATAKRSAKPPVKKPIRSARLDIRMTVEQRELMVAAAHARGLTVTKFLLAVALERAQDIVRDETVTELSLRDWSRIQEMLDNPTPPNQALRDALAEYKESVSSDLDD